MPVKHNIFLLDKNAQGEGLITIKTLQQLAEYRSYKHVEITEREGASRPVINLRVNPEDEPALLGSVDYKTLKEDYIQSGAQDPETSQLIAMIDSALEEFGREQ